MRFKLSMALGCTVLLSACQTPYTGPANINIVHQTGERLGDVNADYASGRTGQTGAQTPSLEDMENITASSGLHLDKDLEKRVPILRSAALAYGAQGGLAYGAKQINIMLDEDAPRLQQVYSFDSLLFHDGYSTVLPPVIVEAKDTYEQQDNDDTLRIADSYYKIIQQAHFTSSAPSWRMYLRQSVVPPNRPSDDSLPKNDDERAIWNTYLKTAWDQGIEQSQKVFKMSLRRLERDRNGMILFHKLLSQNLVSAPSIATQSLGNTGSGQDMRVNDNAYRLTSKPRFRIEKSDDWTPAVSNDSVRDAATPPDKTPGDEGGGY